MPRPRKFDEADVVAAARDEFWARGYARDLGRRPDGRHRPGQGQPLRRVRRQARLFLRALDDYIATALDGVRAQLRDPDYSAYDRLTRHIRGQAKAARRRQGAGAGA